MSSTATRIRILTQGLLICAIGVACDVSIDGDPNQTIVSDPAGEGDPTPSGDDDSTPPDDAEDPTPGNLCGDTEAERTLLTIYQEDTNSYAEPVEDRDRIRLGYPIFEQNQLNELLNYYDFQLPPATSPALAMTPELEVLSDEEGRYTLFIGVSGPELSLEARPPLNLAIVVDTSLSMCGRGLELATASLETLAGSLKAGDRISLVAGTDTANVLVDNLEVAGRDPDALLAAIEGLECGGTTELGVALSDAYALAEQGYEPDRINRILAISDGGDSLTVTDELMIASYAADDAQAQIRLVGLGVASDPDVYNDALMYSLTEQGRGAYLYFDSSDEASRQLSGTRLIRNLAIAGEEVVLSVLLPPGLEFDKGSSSSSDVPVADIAPQAIAPNGSIVYFVDLEGCDPGSYSSDAPFTFTVTWRDPVTGELSSSTLETTFGQLLSQGDARARKLRALRLYATALAPHYDWDPVLLYLLLGCFTCETESIPAQAYDEIAAIQSGLNDSDLAEVLSLLETYIAYSE